MQNHNRMTDSAKIKNWIASMAGKNRYELQAVEPLSLNDSREVVADVYDDYLLFSLYGDTNTGEPFLSVLIDRLTPSNVPTIAAKIENAANTANTANAPFKLID